MPVAWLDAHPQIFFYYIAMTGQFTDNSAVNVPHRAEW